KKAIELAGDIDNIITDRALDGYLMCVKNKSKTGTRKSSHKYFLPCEEMRRAWLSQDMTYDETRNNGCKLSDMKKLRDTAEDFRFKNLDKATTKKIINCVDYWVFRTKDIQNSVTKYQNKKLAVDIKNDRHGWFKWDPIRAYREKMGAAQDFNKYGGIRRNLKLHSGMVSRQLGSKLAPLYKIGQASFEEMIAFGVGLEVKDHNYGARFGAYGQVGSLGFPQDWTFEEAFQCGTLER
ncbi:expressed unknown protein (Partial), partial [Seminavis robusta]